MPFTALQLRLVATLLDRRGFVISSDVPVVNQKNFASELVASMEHLIDCGYSGDVFYPWSTGFRRSIFDYGVVRETAGITDEYVDRYVTAVETDDTGDRLRSTLREDRITVKEFHQWLVGIEFECEKCGHTGKSALTECSKGNRDIFISDIRGKCSCGHSGAKLIGIYRNFSP